jgi:hypothetical protein
VAALHKSRELVAVHFELVLIQSKWCEKWKKWNKELERINRKEKEKREE